MKTLPAQKVDRNLLERMYNGYADFVRDKLGRLAERTLFQTRPRPDVFSAAAFGTGLGKLGDARAALSCLARLCSASLELGAATGTKTLELRWPHGQSRVAVRGPADPVTALEWVRSLCAALIARDAEAEMAIRSHSPVASTAALSWNPYWDAWVDAWKHALGGRTDLAGAALATALKHADPDRAYDEEDAQFMLAVVAPAIEVMFRALDRDARGCDEAIETGVTRLMQLYQYHPVEELRYLPVHLLGAIRLGERLGVPRQVDSSLLAILDDRLTAASPPA